MKTILPVLAVMGALIAVPATAQMVNGGNSSESTPVGAKAASTPDTTANTPGQAEAQVAGNINDRDFKTDAQTASTATVVKTEPVETNR